MDMAYCACGADGPCAFHGAPTKDQQLCEQVPGCVYTVGHPKALACKVLKPENVLEEANRVVYGDRAKSYGKACENHANTGDFYDAWLQARYGDGPQNMGTDAYDVCAFNIGQKLARLAHALKTTGKIHRDSVVDGAGYFANMEKIDNGE